MIFKATARHWFGRV